MRRLRLLTAGESHGPALSGILEGLPAGLRVSTAKVDLDLRRRQHGYGSGRRMQIERDRVTWTAGIRYGRTLGSPVGFTVENRDWVNWTDRMAVEPIPAARRPKPITRARPGHVDLAGAIKYDTDDIRDVLERASARATAARTVAGSLSRQLLAACGVRIWSFVDQVGPIRAFADTDEPMRRIPDGWFERDLRDPSPLRCPDPEAERGDAGRDRRRARRGRHHRRLVRGRGGGRADGPGIVVGVGHAPGRAAGRRADGASRRQRAVEIGLGFGVVPLRGSQSTTWSTARPMVGAGSRTMPAGSRAASATASRSWRASP